MKTCGVIWNEYNENKIFKNIVQTFIFEEIF